MDVIVISGGSRGIGVAAARAFADRGLGVTLTYNSHPEAAKAARRVLAGEAQPGFLTPGTLFGNGFAESISDTTIQINQD